MRRIIVITFVLLSLGHAAWAGKKSKDGPGTKAVKSANATISALLQKEVVAGSKEEQELAAKVTASVRDFLDIDALGERALADHWDTLSTTQRTEFLDVLRGLLEDNYVKGLRANLEYKVTYKGESKNADGTRLVKTEIKTKRRNRDYTIKVDYTLVEDGGKWKCFDVATDGVGLVENYRAQFNKIISKDGFDGLIKKMKKKRAA
jgi:phospholipid transport system substrate-binding protein